MPASSGCWAGGEEERRISDPNSICWRTWPAPRQAENSTYVSTCMQCWLCPRRALPSCCAPLPRPSPQPRSRARAFGSRQRASSFHRSTRCFGSPGEARPRGPGHPLQSHCSGDAQRAQSRSLVLSPSAAFCLWHEVCPARCPAAAASPSSSGAGEDEHGSRQEMCFIRNKQLAPAPRGRRAGRRMRPCGAVLEHARVRGQLPQQAGNLCKPPALLGCWSRCRAELGQSLSPPCFESPPLRKYPGQAAQDGGNTEFLSTRLMG